MRASAPGLLALVVLFAPAELRADESGELLRKAMEAFARREFTRTVELTGKAIERDPRKADAYSLRAAALEQLGKHAEAVADLTRVLELEPKAATAYHRRGCERFKLGLMKPAIEDFDRFLELAPAERNGHWQRGIALYYAGRFEDGMKQFAAYERVDTNDVENAVWHFLCNARANGVEHARKELLRIGHDTRVPMMQVYDLFAGKLKPEDVLAAAEKGEAGDLSRNRQRFYARLYLGLYFEVLGERDKAAENLRKAALDHKVDHYMWDVARVHHELLEKDRAKRP